MIVIEGVHTMKINIMRLTLPMVSLKETAMKMESQREKIISKHLQAMNGTSLLPVNLCFGVLSLFCQKISMNNGILINLKD